ncbi:hypothetical protein M0G74_07300 [Microbulbifer sp. CAU 1566]|uniref:alpha-glutamyl/putrescinyl thymine pyrophosphorylase clade 3 protein n=1 Tax=Microbulbifer sp. CAU 1566 TaxID=2933269 RepID=UPI0020059BE1|nr:hypothetical protein [Microbulbifer sp. CAU 1566]MCK7597079.1 hypothetical protein [Microbulbifer sp. CAU 1566]
MSREEYRALLSSQLEQLDGVVPLQGLRNENMRSCLVEQFIDSIRRIDYVRVLSERGVSEQVADPTNDMFDPIKAAVLYQEQGNIDEACWLVFLAIHVGKNARSGWTRVRDLYGALGADIWSWERVCGNLDDFGVWLERNYMNIGGAFGNHRKYESIRPNVQGSPINVVRSYIEWIGGSHQTFFSFTQQEVDCCPNAHFDYLYNSMFFVRRFSRLSIFDYLTMLAKVGVVDISPPRAYLDMATGPKKGAKLLFTGSRDSNESTENLEGFLVLLNENMSLGYLSMQVLEDALCNWQKSPERHVRFRG